MRAIERYLAVGETIVCLVHRHWAVVLRPIAETVGVFVAAVVVGTLFDPNDRSDLFDVVGGVATALMLLRLLWRFLEWRRAEIVVTNRRIFEVSGILSRRVSSMPLAKVTDMTYHRSLLGLVLGYGDLRIESPGQKQAVEMIGHVPRPDDFYRTVTSLVMAPSPDEREDVAEEVSDAQADDTGPLPRVPF